MIQRRHPRRELHARCWIVGGRYTVYLRVHDLSLGGLSVRAPVPFPPDAPVDLKLELPGGKCAHARGRVVWVRAHGGESGPRMGARFVELVDGEESLYNALAAPEN